MGDVARIQRGENCRRDGREFLLSLSRFRPYCLRQSAQIPGVSFPGGKSWVAKNPPKQREVRLYPTDEILIDGALQPRDRLLPIFGKSNELCQQGIIVERHIPASINPAVHADTRP